jgi:hypothetical protein
MPPERGWREACRQSSPRLDRWRLLHRHTSNTTYCWIWHARAACRGAVGSREHDAPPPLLSARSRGNERRGEDEGQRVEGPTREGGARCRGGRGGGGAGEAAVGAVQGAEGGDNG